MVMRSSTILERFVVRISTRCRACVFVS